MKRVWKRLAELFRRRPPNGAFGSANARAAAEMKIEIYRAATGKTETVGGKK